MEEERIDFTCWHVHNDWVDMVRYYPETDQVVSCSSDINASLVIGQLTRRLLHVCNEDHEVSGFSPSVTNITETSDLGVCE